MIVYNKIIKTTYRMKITDLPGPQFLEMRDWLDENIGSANWTHKWNTNSSLMIDYFYFTHEEDAMAFKLMWS